MSTFLTDYCHFSSNEKKFFVKFIGSMPNYSASLLFRHLSFMLIQLTWESKSFAVLRLGFFNVSFSDRQIAINDLCNAILAPPSSSSSSSSSTSTSTTTTNQLPNSPSQGPIGAVGLAFQNSGNITELSSHATPSSMSTNSSSTIQSPINATQQQQQQQQQNQQNQQQSGNFEIRPCILSSGQTSPKYLLPVYVRYDAPLVQKQMKYNEASLAAELVVVPTLPTEQILLYFMHVKRYIWPIPFQNTREQVVELLLHNRLKEGYKLTSSSGVFSLVKIHNETTTTQNSNNSNSVRSSLPCILQYLIYKVSPTIVVTEFWMEPTSIQSNEIFNKLEQAIYQADSYQISYLGTFDRLLEMTGPVYNEASDLTRGQDIQDGFLTV